jgi:hypothetical protein
MATGHTHPKTLGLELEAELGEADIGVRFSAQEFFQRFLGTHALKIIQPKIGRPARAPSRRKS